MTAVWLRVTTVISVLAVWMVIITLMPIILGFTESTFFSFGPNTTVAFFGMRVDTWPRWVFIIVYIVINQILQTYGLETITPWTVSYTHLDVYKRQGLSRPQYVQQCNPTQVPDIDTNLYKGRRPYLSLIHI